MGAGRRGAGARRRERCRNRGARSRELCVAGETERMASRGGRAGRETKKHLEEAEEGATALSGAHMELAMWAAEERAVRVLLYSTPDTKVPSEI